MSLPARLLALFVAAVLAVATAHAQDLVGPSADWRWLEGQAEPPATWADPGFDDSSWSVGRAGFGYGDGDDTTVITGMQGRSVSLYLRTRFDVADPAAIAGLLLEIDSDDGFVAFLNGTEVARRGLLGAPVPHDRTAWDHEAGAPELVPLSDAARLLVAGTNVLAIQVHDSSLSSSDLSCIPRLTTLPHDPASRGPYLQAARPDSVVVRWRTTLPAASRVEHGEGSLLDRVAGSAELVTDHEVALRGLRPGTRHSYRVVDDSGPRSEILSFWTLPRTGSDGFDVASASASCARS
jgi:hypothetical protein